MNAAPLTVSPSRTTVTSSSSIASHAAVKTLFLHHKIPKSSSISYSRARGGRRSLHVTSSLTELSREELKEGIKEFYNESSTVWEDIWGEHMHHGYYYPDSSSGSVNQKQVESGGFSEGEELSEKFKFGLSDVINSPDMTFHREAQVRMIEKTLEWAGVPEGISTAPRSVLDVGCGIGGSARHLYQKYINKNRKAEKGEYDGRVIGITLSDYQARRGNQICKERGLEGKVSLQVTDALDTGFPDSSFDLVWSMESGEHMPDKEKFVGECLRVCSDGGHVIIVTWCHRNLKRKEGGQEKEALTNEEQELLGKICDAYYLPAWCSLDDYVQIAERKGLKDIKTADWSEFVAPFWPAVMSTAFKPEGLAGLLKSGWSTIRGAWAMYFMLQGFQKGLIKFVLISGVKDAKKE